jgi:hypothetical protein
MTVGEGCRMLAVLTTESSARTASEPVDRHHRPRPGITGTGRAGGVTALSLAAEGHVPPSRQAHSSRDLLLTGSRFRTRPRGRVGFPGSPIGGPGLPQRQVPDRMYRGSQDLPAWGRWRLRRR